MNKCKKYHDWNIGAGISNSKDEEIGIFLCCKNCKNITEAYYKVKKRKTPLKEGKK